MFGHRDDFAAKQRLREQLDAAAGGPRFVDVDHHLCHAAGAYYCSGWPEATIVSLDGYGDGSCGLLAHGAGGRIVELQRLSEADSIGLEYLRATMHLGLGGIGAEGKTQGLAAYGEPALWQAYMNEIGITADGAVTLSPRLRGQDSRLAREGGYLNSLNFRNDFLHGCLSPRIDPEPIEQQHRNLAASIQKTLETVVSELARIAVRRSGVDDLVLAGGVAMNSSVIGALAQCGLFKRVFSLPMASDRGIGLGAALYHAHHQLGIERFFELRHVFYGDSINQNEAVRAMHDAGLDVHRSDDVVNETARHLADGEVVGWCQGRSEVGARALGHRSILASPVDTSMRDRINARVKRREGFRPFAPSVLKERLADYFEPAAGVIEHDFMTCTLPARDAAVAAAPAVVHVDGTARVHAVDPAGRPLFGGLIEAFFGLTGVPMLLNTSFNGHGEPMVESAADAVAMFVDSDIDLLCIGELIGVRPR